MCKFAVKERGENQPCFVAEDEGLVYFERRPGSGQRGSCVPESTNQEVTVDRRLEEYILGSRLRVASCGFRVRDRARQAKRETSQANT